MRKRIKPKPGGGTFLTHNKTKAIEQAQKNGSPASRLSYKGGDMHILFNDGHQVREKPKDRSMSPRQLRKIKKAENRARAVMSRVSPVDVDAMVKQATEDALRGQTADAGLVVTS